MKRAFGSVPVLTMVLMLAAGCATLDGGVRRDHAEIVQTLEAFRSAFLSEDTDAMAALLAEDFESAEGRDKAAMRNFLDGLVVQGYLSNVDMLLDDAEVIIADDRASAYPVRITEPSLSKEGIAVEFTLARRDGHWLIVRSRQEGGAY